MDRLKERNMYELFGRLEQAIIELSYASQELGFTLGREDHAHAVTHGITKRCAWEHTFEILNTIQNKYTEENHATEKETN